MTTKTKIIAVLGLIPAFLFGELIFAGIFLVHASAPGVRDTFNQVQLATTTSVGTAGVEAISVLNGASSYWMIDNSGSGGASCFPSATTTGFTYGGGWWLAPNGGVISMDSTALYNGPVSCLTGSGTTTIGVIAQ
jgi:hypothetical protein